MLHTILLSWLLCLWRFKHVCCQGKLVNKLCKVNTHNNIDD